MPQRLSILIWTAPAQTVMLNMALKRIILEMGTGNDLYGEDYTKAACRAVQDALHHSSIIMFRSLGIDRESMQITVAIGVQQPNKIDVELVARELPFGTVVLKPELGGLNLVDAENDTVSVIATAGISVFLDLPEGKYVI